MSAWGGQFYLHVQVSLLSNRRESKDTAVLLFNSSWAVLDLLELDDHRKKHIPPSSTSIAKAFSPYLDNKYFPSSKPPLKST